jgi:hypothetical protein
MSRDLPAGMADAVTAPVIAPAWLVELQWVTGTVYAWTGYGEIAWDSKTWVGTGHLGAISEIRESRDGYINGVKLSMSGIPMENLALALAKDSQGMPGKVFFALRADDGTFAHGPYQIFDGIIDVCPIVDTGSTLTITVHLEKEQIDTRVRGRRNTHEDQQIDHPGDLFFEHVAGIADKELPWGHAGSASGIGAPSTDQGHVYDPYQ